MIELNKTYIHYKNKKSYTPLNFCKVQENDIWIEAIIYKLKNKSSNTTDTTKKTVVESGEVVK